MMSDNVSVTLKLKIKYLPTIHVRFFTRNGSPVQTYVNLNEM